MRGLSMLVFVLALAPDPCMAQAQARAIAESGPAPAGAARLGGAATIDDAGPNAFGYAAPFLTPTERRAFVVGNSFFKQNWVSSPSSTEGRDGLGLLFNARSCSACHLRDGRSRPPEPDETAHEGLLVRVGIPSATGADLPHPRYGGQIQDSAVPGIRPEARVTISWEPRAGAFGDGARFDVLAPRYRLTDLGYGPLEAAATIGPRTAPHLVGLGLLEAVPEAAILALADPDDRDGDGISGRAHLLASGEPGRPELGRFGWKATQPTVRAQTAAAFVHDMGITSTLFPEEPLTPVEREQAAAAGDRKPEIDDHKLDRVVFYARVLAVPAQRNPDDGRVVAGSRLFDAFRCSACHVPTLVTGEEAVIPGYRRQAIHPFTDLLLHDLGPDLADGKRDGTAEPREWRTAPLWGIGLIPVVNGHSRYLHDGRARSLTEAVLWHGGEAASSRERFRTAPRDDREALIAFLESL
jgi:CxxC motif-containing protein (DUF1111 family)